MPSIVVIVTMPNNEPTRIMPTSDCWAAGYIEKGIKGSHGPSTKMTKSTQGVKLVELAWP